MRRRTIVPDDRWLVGGSCHHHERGAARSTAVATFPGERRRVRFVRYAPVGMDRSSEGKHRASQPRPRRHPMNLLVLLLVVFLIFLVAGWGWNRGRGGL
jgi:hypothetical protein